MEKAQVVQGAVIEQPLDAIVVSPWPTKLRGARVSEPWGTSPWGAELMPRGTAFERGSRAARRARGRQSREPQGSQNRRPRRGTPRRRGGDAAAARRIATRRSGVRSRAGDVFEDKRPPADRAPSRSARDGDVCMTGCAGAVRARDGETYETLRRDDPTRRARRAGAATTTSIAGPTCRSAATPTSARPACGRKSRTRWPSTSSRTRSSARRRATVPRAAARRRATRTARTRACSPSPSRCSRVWAASRSRASCRSCRASR